MAEYIEREALKKIFIDHYADEYPTSLILAVIDNVPAADVEEVRHGKWYRHNEKEHGDTCYYCSYCEEMALSDCMVWELTDYCPNCGEKMDLGED